MRLFKTLLSAFLERSFCHLKTVSKPHVTNEVLRALTRIHEILTVVIVRIPRLRPCKESKNVILHKKEK